MGQKITANGGTDGANIVLFWPDNLPDDGDAVLKTDPVNLVEKLQNDGKLIWFLCDGDGGYTVAIFVRCEVPDDLRAFCGDEERYPMLIVRGDGYFGGMEYMFKHDASFLKAHPGMCEKVTIPDGTYSARVYRTKLPKTLFASWLLNQAGSSAMRLWQLRGILAVCSAFSLTACLVSFFFVPWAVWYCVLASTSALVIGTWTLSRTQAYRSVKRACDEFAMAYPSYVVRFE